MCLLYYTAGYTEELSYVLYLEKMRQARKMGRNLRQTFWQIHLTFIECYTPGTLLNALTRFHSLY